MVGNFLETNLHSFQFLTFALGLFAKLFSYKLLQSIHQILREAVLIHVSFIGIGEGVFLVVTSFHSKSVIGIETFGKATCESLLADRINHEAAKRKFFVIQLVRKTLSTFVLKEALYLTEEFFAYDRVEKSLVTFSKLIDPASIKFVTDHIVKVRATNRLSILLSESFLQHHSPDIFYGIETSGH